MKTRIFLTVLAFVAFVGISSAQQKPVSQDVKQQQQTSFVDANNDGVCDNFTGVSKGKNQGLKQVKSQGNGQVKNNCDGSGKGKSTKKGIGNVQGQRSNFIDANNNGICDNRE